MKKLLYLLLLFVIHTQAQQKMTEAQLPISGDLHFISPEPIRYVDISNKSIAGDIPLPNILRLRFRDSCYADAIVTIVGEKFIAQYYLRPVSSTEIQKIDIQPSDTSPLDIAGAGLSHPQLIKLAWNIFVYAKNETVQSENAFGIRAKLNKVYTAGDYLFIDVSYKNKTKLRYDIENFSFRLDDKKVTKATNVQSVDIRPELALLDNPAFEKSYRNVFVFKKMSFPGNKVFKIELSEKQLSGRVITLQVSYQDILSADTVPVF